MYMDMNTLPLETSHFRYVTTIPNLVMFDLCFLDGRFTGAQLF